ncbi:MAG: mandelate racemase/muconate lactonizing enzyme family protein [Bacteroidetes bacterium]|nr:mandelate racemase/muconate lactonizing enzyme family protein [Bacteroidota bacterium]
MKITNVRTTVLRGVDPHGMGGTPRTWHLIVVRIDTDTGIYGLGEAPHWQRGYFGVRETIDYIGSRIIGQSPFEIKRIIQEHFHGARPPHQPRTLPATIVPVGPIVWAMSGIEMALLDIVGKHLKTPVYNLLGGQFRSKIPVYLDRSGPANVSDLSAWKKLAAETVESGFTRLKFDIDHVAPDLVDDVWSRTISKKQLNAISKRLGAAIEAIGPDAEVAVDCHMHYDVPSAIKLSHALAELGVTWLEDPTPVMNFDAMRQIKERSAVPICVGEMFTADMARMFIDHEACDILHPDILFAGGLHETRRICEYAELHHLPIAFHNNSTVLGVTATSHLASTIPNLIALEYHFFDSPWSMTWIKRACGPLIVDGYIQIDDTPGLGCELDTDVCEKLLAYGEKLFE